MKPPSISGLVHVGLDVLTTVVNTLTGKIAAQTGDVVSETAEGDGIEWWQHVGFLSRPPKPQPGKQAAQVVVVKTSDRDAAVASQDLRGLALAGNLRDGETCLYAAGDDGNAQARVMLKADGSIALFTTSTNTEDGKSVYFLVAPDGFKFVAPWGTLKFDATGFHVIHSSGASFDLGGIYGLPAPLDKLTSYVRMQAATVSAKASAIKNGAGVAAPLANATQTAAALSALQTQVSALQAAITALQLDPTHVASATAVTAAASAVTTGATALSTATAALPTSASST